MLNKKFTGVVKSVSVIEKKTKAPDGSKVNYLYHQVKLESSDIDYESMNEFNMNIAQTLLAIQPMPFDSITFPRQNIKNLCLNLNLKASDEFENETSPTPTDNPGIDLAHVEMDKIIVATKENIPTYCFFLLVPFDKNPNSKYISEFYKMINEFEFSIKKDDQE